MDAKTRQVIAFHVGDRSRKSAKLERGKGCKALPIATRSRDLWPALRTRGPDRGSRRWHTTFQKLTRCGMVRVEVQDFGHMLSRLGESPLPG